MPYYFSITQFARANSSSHHQLELLNNRNYKYHRASGSIPLCVHAPLATQLLAMDKCLDDAHKAAKMAANGQGSLFDGFAEDQHSIAPELELPSSEEMPFEQLLQFERDLLGFYLHEPTYMKHIRIMKDYTSFQIRQLHEEEEGPGDKKHTIGGVIHEVKKIFTKKNNQ
jgi:DNA polymerase III alpha subunit